MISKGLYPDCERPGDRYFRAPHDYLPIIEHLAGPSGYVSVQVEDDEALGDIRLLLIDENGRYGFLIFDYGCNTFNDRLLSTTCYEDIEIVIQDLEDAVEWFDSAIDAFDELSTMHWGDVWVGRIELFVNEVFRQLAETVSLAVAAEARG